VTAHRTSQLTPVAHGVNARAVGSTLPGVGADTEIEKC
jgi:hypothetical protein